MQNGETAIFYAALNGHNNVVSHLVEARADVNLPEKVILLSLVVYSDQSCLSCREWSFTEILHCHEKLYHKNFWNEGDNENKC